MIKILAVLEPAVYKAHNFCNRHLPAVLTGMYPAGDARRYAPCTKLQTLYATLWSWHRWIEIKVYC